MLSSSVSKDLNSLNLTSENVQFSSRNSLMYNSIKRDVVPVHGQRHSLRSSSESDSISPTNKFYVSSPLSIPPSPYYQDLFERNQQSSVLPQKNSKKIVTRPARLLNISDSQKTVPCHEVFCAYSNSPASRNLQALLRESARVHSLRAPKTVHTKNCRGTTQSFCCSGTDSSPSLSGHRPVTIGKASRNSAGTPGGNSSGRRLGGGTRPHCSLCRQSTTGSKMTRHTRGRQAVLCMVLSLLLPQAAPF